MQPQMPISEKKISTGIDLDSRQEVAKELSVVLADTYMLYLKTQNYHWNVTGHMFHALHVLFEQQYTELAASIDVLAERIRALGIYAPGTFAQFSKLSSIREDASIPSAEEMIKSLMADKEVIVSRARKVMTVAENDHDDVTADLLTQRMNAHEKAAWMLRSFIKQ